VNRQVRIDLGSIVAISNKSMAGRRWGHASSQSATGQSFESLVHRVVVMVAARGGAILLAQIHAGNRIGEAVELAQILVLQRYAVEVGADSQLPLAQLPLFGDELVNLVLGRGQVVRHPVKVQIIRVNFGHLVVVPMLVDLLHTMGIQAVESSKAKVLHRIKVPLHRCIGHKI